MPLLTAAFAGTLTASLDDRTITGLLLPFGEEGATNLGRLTASAHTLTLPDDPTSCHLNTEHDPTHPIGRATAITEAAEGIRATFSVVRTQAGDDALTEAAEGLRACLSVEVDDPVIRSGHLVAGLITGAALVARPAFPSAQLAAAEDIGEYTQDTTSTYTDPYTGETIRHTTHTEETETLLDPEDDPEDDPTDQQDPPATEDDPTDPQKETPPMTATAHAPRTGLAASKTPATPPADKSRLYRLLAGASTGDRQMLAALADVIPANILGIEQPQYVGQLWKGKAYVRQFITAWNHADLTSWSVKGWRWGTRPTVAPYTGNKTAVPSAAISTEQVDITAERIAGAHDIDRKFRDFNDTEFWAAYFAAMTESYARVSDTTALATVTTAATPVTAGTVPAGVSAGMVQIVDGILAILAETDTVPDTAFMATDLYRDVLLTRQDDILAYLNAALGFEEGTLRNFRIVPTAQITTGKTLVTCRDAVTVHELGGEAPIRVEALDIARGGVDEGVFGYLAVNVHDAGGLALVSAGV